MTDRARIEALIARDEQVTEHFFFEECRPLFVSIIRHVFSYEVDYDEFVNEFYLYLMENDAARLRGFEGRSSLFQWLKVVAIRYFVAKRNRLIDNAPQKPLKSEDVRPDGGASERHTTARIDLQKLFDAMPNRRYVYLVRRLILEDAEPQQVAAELGVSVENIYNLKKRALAAFAQLVLNERNYE